MGCCQFSRSSAQMLKVVCTAADRPAYGQSLTQPYDEAMGWFNIIIGVFLVLSAAILYFWIEGMRKRGVLNVGIASVDSFNNSRLRAVPLYLLAAVGVGFILYQLVVALLN